MEQGSHAHLLEHHPQGAYATLLRLQLMAQEADKADALGANMLDAGPDDAIPPEALQQLQACLYHSSACMRAVACRCKHCVDASCEDVPTKPASAEACMTRVFKLAGDTC